MRKQHYDPVPMIPDDDEFKDEKYDQPHTIEEVGKLLVKEADNESFETGVQKEDLLNFCKSNTWLKVVVVVIIIILLLIFFVHVSVTNTNTSIRIDEQETHEFIMNDEHLKWCDHLHSNGLGNRLASYWLYRSIAFWFNLTFENDAQCSCKKNTHFCSNTRTKMIWTQYLPTELTHTMTLAYLLQSQNENENNTIYESISLQTDEYEKWINFASLIKDDWSNIDYSEIGTVHEHPILISVINTLFLKIVRYEMQQAFKSYYSERHRNDIIMKEYQNNQMNGIIVHWRCGDILSGNTYHYGFNGLSYYSDALTLFDLNKDSNISVSVMVNLDKKTSRGKDLKYFDECSKLLSLINDKFRNVFRNVTTSPMNYTVISDGTINSDMYLLSNAKYIICGVSSFCEMAGIGNKNNIIFRDIGRQHIWMNKANKKYFPKHIHMLPIKNRVIHPRDVDSNLIQIAQYIVNH